jgi:flavin reductase (DIM6/NTAB) family NADH-FMN oxidoreductase RutF
VPIDDAKFKLAMSHFASGVTVVTTHHEGRPYGMTVASFASLSLHPPLILVCIEKNVRTHDVIAAAGRFAVNILGSEQADISNRFASKSEDKFEGVTTNTGRDGVPLIPGAVCTIECRVQQQLPGGDHSIFVGEVLEIETGEGAPLVYYRSGYRQITT